MEQEHSSGTLRGSSLLQATVASHSTHPEVQWLAAAYSLLNDSLIHKLLATAYVRRTQAVHTFPGGSQTQAASSSKAGQREES